MATKTGKVPKNAAVQRKRPPGGSRKGRPNKITADVKAMVLAALNQAGGPEYLYRQSMENPKAFLALVGKLMPLQLSGDGGGPLQFVISDKEADL